MVGVAAATLTQPTLSHGMSPEVEAIIVVAIVDMCRADQPSMRAELDASFSSWARRNEKYLVAAKTRDGRAEYEKAVALARETYAEYRPFPKGYCQIVIDSVLSQEGDIHDD